MAERKERDEEARDLLAAQFALGTLDLAERREAERLAAAEPAFAALVEQWQERLAPLAEGYEPVPPPVAAKSAIEARLFGAPQAATGFWHSLAFWRPFALAASLLLVVSLGINLYRWETPGQGGSLVVSLQSVEASPVNFVALYRPDSGAMRLSPVSGEAGIGKDFELWLIEGDTAPVSLGVLPKSGVAEISLPPALADRFHAGTALAISLEPEGGSPTGVATGPVVALGKANPI
ncbi:MAG: anti-sigma factor [Nitratireductor sp.]|nr:anti-sigma factor [Nitratireductor sp.]